jgi:hypothetical protein
MHPLIRVVCFLIFAGWLALGDLSRLLCAFLLLILGYIWLGSPLRPARTMLYRLRWFFVSLLVLYGWFTPGEALWFAAGSAVAAVVPSIEGLIAGLGRIAALTAIVLGVNLLLRSTTREQLLTAVYGLARPLSPFGKLRERLAIRMALVIEVLESVRALVATRLATSGGLRSVRAAGELTSQVVIDVIERADSDTKEVRTVTDDPVPLLQWVYPMGLWAIFYAAGWVNS